MVYPTQVELKSLLDYDPMTGMLIWKLRTSKQLSNPRSLKIFNAQYAGKTALNSTNNRQYKCGRINGICVLTHQIIFILIYGYKPKFIDHIDHNRANNILTNLREVTRTQNQQNRIIPSNNKSGIVGVRWDEKLNKWEVCIGVNGKIKKLGRFKTKQKAINIRRKAELKYNYHPNHGKKRE